MDTALVISFPPIGAFGLALTLIGALVSLVTIEGRKKFLLAGVFIVLGVGEFISIEISDKAHKEEVANQHSDIVNLQGQIQKSDVERQVSEAYLKAKLEDSYSMNAQLAQFAPALMKLAQTSADFERKQFEIKITTNKELYDFTMSVAKRIRDFSQKYSNLQNQQTTEEMKRNYVNLSETERRRIFAEDTQKDLQLYNQKDFEFRNTILADALYARNEFQKRKIVVPPLGQRSTMDVDLALQGILSGPQPELRLADYLELLAKQLPLK
ncbi:MAG: hypothetical protein ABSB65_09710 [Candidatus Acidiferrales bacterium]|jgi:hypothetical protein